MSTKSFVAPAEIRPLTRNEIERRIDSLSRRLAVDGQVAQATRQDLRPQWISASDLVDRIRPFIVLN